jgi:hypothetical protein
MTDQSIVFFIVGWAFGMVFRSYVTPMFRYIWDDNITNRCTGNCDQGRNCTCKGEDNASKSNGIDW